MPAQSKTSNRRSVFDDYTYLQFIISEKTGRIQVNIIDNASGRVVHHISSGELEEIIQDYISLHTVRSFVQLGARGNGKIQ